ncbi:MAG: hypothetical protein FWC46_05385 [Actinomycetia bacterium]|nr:hypothetical protein [Actinomycetes bacterium]
MAGWGARACGAVCAATVALALAGCTADRDAGDPGGVPATPTTGVTGATTPTDGSPPPFLVRAGGDTVEVRPFTFCWRTMCADGFPLDPPTVTLAPVIDVWAPVEMTRLTASLAPADEAGADPSPITVQSLGSGWWRVHPVAESGQDYVLDLFASGRGDMAGRVRLMAS